MLHNAMDAEVKAAGATPRPKCLTSP